jgi:8-oxo-dGTP pyrophosphatase MutT (NUDIX family)
MRALIRSELESISPMDALELRHRSEALDWVDSGAPLFRTAKPATPPQHLVSYFVVVDGESILLVDHKNAQLWLPPGGHVEEGEHPRDTVAREVREELGFAPVHEIAAPLMVTCTTTVGLTSGHTDVSLWYLVNAMLFGFNLGLWFSVAMCLLAGGSILYQTSNLINQYTSDDYIPAALGLFASLMLLFWYVLSIFMSRD